MNPVAVEVTLEILMLVEPLNLVDFTDLKNSTAIFSFCRTYIKSSISSYHINNWEFQKHSITVGKKPRSCFEMLFLCAFV